MTAKQIALKKANLGFSAILFSFIHYRQLIWQMTKREVLGRYRGSIAGLLWSFINPLIMLFVYTFFFTVIFKARWHEDPGNKFDFALVLFTGLIPYTLFSECVNKAPSLILNNVNYVKKVMFPLEVLPWVQLGSAIFHMCVSFIALLIIWFLVHPIFHWTMIFLPLVNLPLFLIALGLMWFLSALAVYVRDVVQSVSLFTLAFLFLSPVFYSLNSIGEPYKTLISLNPLTFIIEQNREILLWGHMPDWYGYLWSLLIGCVVAWLGFIWFQMTRSGFADVL